MPKLNWHQHLSFAVCSSPPIPNSIDSEPLIWWPFRNSERNFSCQWYNHNSTVFLSSAPHFWMAKLIPVSISICHSLWRKILDYIISCVSHKKWLHDFQHETNAFFIIKNGQIFVFTFHLECVAICIHLKGQNRAIAIRIWLASLWEINRLTFP